MPGIIIRGCGIVTMNASGECLPQGEIRIDGDRLAYVGPPREREADAAEEIDAAGLVALPGFVSGHHHLFQSLLRGMAPDTDLREWLSACILPTSPHFRPEDLYAGARLTLAECIESGVTSIVDWSFNLHGVEHAVATFEAMRDSGARVHFAYGPSLGAGWHDFDLRLDDFEAIRTRCFGPRPACDRITLWAGLAGPELQSEERFREEVAFARERGCRIHLHLRENESFEPKDAAERMEAWGTLGPDVLLAHAIHLRDVDLDVLARTQTKVSYNALSNMRVADGICRVVELRERGVDVAIGLDGSASTDNNDFFALMRAAVGLQRARWLRGDCLTAEQVLRMATIEGARCLGQEDEIGSLEPGKKADLVLVDPHTLNFMPVNDFIPQLVFCGQPRNVDTVIVAGRVLKRRGALVGVDIPSLVAAAQGAATRVTTAAAVRNGFRPLPYQ